jgi:hypothetical protein
LLLTFKPSVDCFLLASPYGEAFYCEHRAAKGDNCFIAQCIAQFDWLFTCCQDGTKIPAVYVVGRNECANGMARRKDLEVTMREFPERLPRAGVGIVDVLQQWEVVLVQYNTTGAELSSAMDRMTRRFPDATFRYLPGDDIAYERCRIIIPDRQVKNLIR